MTTAVTVTACLARSRAGFPLPTLEVWPPPESHFRVVSARMHELAAAIERATAPNEQWLVYLMRDSGGGGRVIVELMDGSEEEAERAMATLREVLR